MKLSLAQKNIYGSVVLITGASSGIGFDIARFLSENGFRVYGASRNAKDPDSMPFEWVSMDVCDTDSVNCGVNHVLESEGRIDILINVAGIGVCGSIEESTAKDALLQMDTNYLGTLRLINAVLPGMRERECGLIINIGSVGGIFSVPFQTLYSSSKAALHLLTEGLRMELAPYPGLNAALVAPGDVKTGFTATRRYVKKPEDSPYGRRYEKAVRQMELDETNGLKPCAVTCVVVNIIRRKRPPVCRIVGFKYRCFVFLKRLLPSAAVEALITAMYPGKKL